MSMPVIKNAADSAAIRAVRYFFIKYEDFPCFILPASAGFVM
jgi:hypothetical protein